ncbi:hypothetical protein J2X65_001684 [Ancylobacter sp. 3268]|uniref:hypothetical protein n=1 Tax=Ancylobacter sp. 3268 TaxID=2817752 RepID=UPI0028550167|nr:hypothetical protein [Ancylobacter sp. 3268]MDR6952329.1 hypothetical protein [Ancylobacter sp. 3268]
MDLSYEEYVAHSLVVRLRHDKPVSDADFIEAIEEIGWRRDDDHYTDPLIVQLIDEARQLFCEGRRADALIRLERAAYPKWRSMHRCREDYEAAWPMQFLFNLDAAHENHL